MKIFLVILTGFFQLIAADHLIINTTNRNVTSLNGSWNYIVDPYENGFYNYRYQAFDSLNYAAKSAFFRNAKPQSKSDLIEYDFDLSDSLNVPGDWTSQKEKLFYYEGSVWYKKSFDYKKSAPQNRLFVYFGAVNYKADVYLNGTKLGTHEGGFTPFNFEITGLIKNNDNYLIIKVDNKRVKHGVPTLNTDWWNYGGITRDVRLIETPANFIRDYKIQSDPLDPKNIKGFVQLDGKDIYNKKIIFKIPANRAELKLTTDQNGLAEINFRSEDLQLWSPAQPKLYQIILETDWERLQDQVGFRCIQTRGTDILINGRKIFLKGISAHEENPLQGRRAFSKSDAELLLNWAQEMGCNFMRLAHYPHNEYIVRLADQKGILIWEEIPVYWTIDWQNPLTYQNAERQLAAMINRDKNRAAVIIWSMANETPVSEARNTFLKNLAQTARELDETRLISAALEQKSSKGNHDIRFIEDPFAEFVDILSFNVYIGWYDGLPEKCSRLEWQLPDNKPVIISEFGGGAKFGYHADSLTRWSEEYQQLVYVENLKMLSKIKSLAGMSPWILADFRSPRRVLPGIQDGWNRKGLISDKGEFKKAYFILQKFFRQISK